MTVTVIASPTVTLGGVVTASWLAGAAVTTIVLEVPDSEPWVAPSATDWASNSVTDAEPTPAEKLTLGG